MDATVTVGILSLAGTLIGTLGGILASSRLTNYRIAQLEEKEHKHNNLIDRTYKVEEILAVHEQKLRVTDHRMEALERKNAQ